MNAATETNGSNLPEKLPIEGTLPDSTHDESNVPEKLPIGEVLPSSSPNELNTPEKLPVEGTLPNSTHDESNLPQELLTESIVTNSTPDESNILEKLLKNKVLSDLTREERIILLSTDPNVSDTTTTAAFAEIASIENAKINLQIQKDRQFTRRMGIIAGSILGAGCITLLIVRGEMIHEVAGTAGIVGTVASTALGIVALLIKGNNNSKKTDE